MAQLAVYLPGVCGVQCPAPHKSDVVVHTFNLGAGQVKALGSRVQGHWTRAPNWDLNCGLKRWPRTCHTSMSLEHQDPSKSAVCICVHRALRERWEAETMGPRELREGGLGRHTTSPVYASENKRPYCKQGDRQ